MDQLPRLGKRELICLLLFACTRNYVASVWRGFLFLWVLRYFIVALPEHSIKYLDDNRRAQVQYWGHKGNMADEHNV